MISVYRDLLFWEVLYDGMSAANGFPFEVQTLQITSHFLSLISMQLSMEFFY
ncbi:hypothetical protein SAMN04488577_2210 [Bacillus sp. cl95]|nr:hypothetical protein SAMN02799634_10291 [Bacillus sp. UNCCL13]SFQ83581.1 hypothetical protein SAMN04488577_2210 [Bacillus sp. cl95]